MPAVIHRHRWRPKAIIDGQLIGSVCAVCHRDRRFPTWGYRLFRLRYVDHCGWDDWAVGVSVYRNGARSTEEHPQLGVMFGHREAIFDLPGWLPLPAAPEED